MTKTTEIAQFAVIAVIVIVIIYFISKAAKSFGDLGAGLGQAGKDIQLFLNDGFKAIDSGLSGADKSINDWWQGFNKNYLNKPIIPIPPAVTPSQLDKTLKRGTGSNSKTGKGSGNPSESTSGDSTTTDGSTTPKVVVNNTNNNYVITGKDPTPADSKPQIIPQLVDLNSISQAQKDGNEVIIRKNYSVQLSDSLDLTTQKIIAARENNKTNTPETKGNNPPDQSTRAQTLALQKIPLKTAIDSGTLTSPLNKTPSIIDQLLQALESVIPASASPIARPVAPVIEAP